MPGPDLPDLEEHLRRLPAVVAVEAPAGLAERIARRGRGRRRLRRAAAAVVAGLLGGVIATRAAVLDRTPTPVLDPGLVVQDATPGQLADGGWQALPPLPPGRLAYRSGPAVVWTGQQLIVWGVSIVVTPSRPSPTAPPTTHGPAAGSCSRPPRRASGWRGTTGWRCGPAGRCWSGAASPSPTRCAPPARRGGPTGSPTIPRGGPGGSSPPLPCSLRGGFTTSGLVRDDPGP